MECQICGAVMPAPSHEVPEITERTGETFAYFTCPRCGCVQIAAPPPDLGRYYRHGYYSLSATGGWARVVLRAARHRRDLGYRPNAPRLARWPAAIFPHAQLRLLAGLLGLCGLGYGLAYSALVLQLTRAVAVTHAADLSGLIQTASRIGGVVGVAAFGAGYLALAPAPGPALAVTAFVRIAAALAVTALAGAAMAQAAGRAAAPPAG